MLARGWLAYPVTPIHSLLPPKSGCICQHIPRFALSRRRATALFRNPVCKAQRSVPGFSSTPNSACRRYATSPPSAVASPHRPPSSSDRPTRRGVSQKNRRRAVSYVSTGLACLPRDTNARTSTAEERLYKRHPGMRQRRITPRNPIRTTRQRRAHGASADTTSMRFGDALLPPLGTAHTNRKNRHPSSRYTAIAKNRRRAVSHVSTGLARLPRDANARATTAEERLYMSSPRLANNLYNRSSAVDPSFYNQPQVGKPTWGYDYPTVLRRLPHLSDCPLGAAHPHQKNRHPSAQYTAIGEKPPKSGLIC